MTFKRHERIKEFEIHMCNRNTKLFPSTIYLSLQENYMRIFNNTLRINQLCMICLFFIVTIF